MNPFVLRTALVFRFVHIQLAFCTKLTITEFFNEFSLRSKNLNPWFIWQRVGKGYFANVGTI